MESKNMTMQFQHCVAISRVYILEIISILRVDEARMNMAALEISFSCADKRNQFHLDHSFALQTFEWPCRFHIWNI